MMQPSRIAVADKDEVTWPFEQHEGKVLSAHHAIHIPLNPAFPDDFRSNIQRKARLVGVVDGRRVVARVGSR